ncbi:GNAT family N-acetyltransferase [Planococcus sp. FY231025]|uniref:GNAT family N-acetyltransferase n=1 Tax=Planococcus sp. FY231025 TaxID=3455699 RepID=UPI003F9167DC
MNTDTQLTSLAVIDDKETWNGVIEGFPENDVYYTFEYCRWNAEKENGEAKLALYQTDSGTVIYPFILRKIVSETDRQLYDITTPYGYGGPLVSGDESVLDEFARHFRIYCVEAGVVSEVIRLHPLLENARYLGRYCDLTYIRKTTAVDLSGPLSEIRENYSSMNKRNIKKAASSGIFCVEVEKSDENISTFLGLYNGTMERKRAASYYYFGFASLKEQLAETPVFRSHLLFVYTGEKVIAGAILYTAKQFAHYHLGASDRSYLELRPNNLVFDAMVEVSKIMGCTLLHLGGGCQENDSLFHYKASFSNHNHFDYFIGTNIYDQELYTELVEEAGRRGGLKEGFFPLYRSI